MGRSPCCDKVGLKKGPWTPEEDQKLLAYIEEHGHGSWRALPSKAGLQRCGKSCRLRWTNYLRPDIKRGKFNLQEEQTIIQLHALLGNRWSAIATHLPKRTDNEIKNYWNTHLKKRLTKMGIDPVTHKPKSDAILSNNDGHSKNTANLSHIAQWESARLEAEARLVRQSKLHSSPSEFSLPEQAFVNTNKLVAPSPPPPPSLDILKAWNGIWTKQSGDVESPKSAGMGESTANSFIEMMGNSAAGSCEDGILMKEEGEEDWGGFRNIFSFGNNYDNHVHVPNGNFGSKFTDLLVNNYNSGEWSFSDGDGDSGDDGSVPRGRGNEDELEADKNYWNGILNLVDTTNSSPPLS